MTAIGSISGATALPMTTNRSAGAAPVTPARGIGDAPGSDSGGGDALAPMRAAMDTAFAIGRPADKADAAAILDTGDDFIAGAQGALGNLDEQMTQRRERLQSGTGTAAQQGEDREQLALMQVLRDRIQQSVDHTIEMLTGDDEASERQRRSVLAPTPHAQRPAPVDPSLVAGAYANGGFSEASLAAGG